MPSLTPMPLELTLLIWSGLLAFAYVTAQSIAYRLQYGVEHAGGTRDNDGKPSVLNGRAERALRNFLETYPIFIALSVGAVLAGSDGLTFWGSQLYFWSRWVYLPLYVSGIPYLRSLVWLVSVIGLILMFIGAAF